MNALIQFAWRDEMPYLLGLALALTGLIWAWAPSARRLAGRSLGIFAACLTGQFMAGLVSWLGFAGGASTLHELFVLASGIALIRLLTLALFRLPLTLIGVQLPRIQEDLAMILGSAGWIMVRLRYSGMDLSGIVATSALVTAIVAFAMQDTLGNILGGLALEWDNSIQLGDWIRVDDVAGRITDMRWRYTSIRTRNGEIVIIPNSQLMKAKFMLLGRPDDASEGQSVSRWRRWVWFNIPFDTQPGRVVELIEHAVQDAEIANVGRSPAPNCVAMEFGPGYVRYALRYWLIDPEHDDATDSAVRCHVMAALTRAGIRLAVPEERRTLVKENAAHDEERSQRETLRRLLALRGVEIFAGCSDAELQTMAGHLAYAPFAQGDVITRQGATAHWLYILISGEVALWYQPAQGERRQLTTLQAGSVFGEMGLMTGEPRRATVVATRDVECYRLDKAGFESIIHARPEIAEEMSHILTTRVHQLEALEEELQHQAKRNGHGGADILARIRSFFGLDQS